VRLHGRRLAESGWVGSGAVGRSVGRSYARGDQVIRASVIDFTRRWSSLTGSSESESRAADRLSASHRGGGGGGGGVPQRHGEKIRGGGGGDGEMEKVDDLLQ